MGLVSIAVSVKLSRVKTSLTARFRLSSVKGLCVPHRLLTTPLGLVLFRTLTEYAGFRKMKVKQQQGWGFFCSYILTAFSCHVLAQVQGENSQKVPEYAQNRSSRYINRVQPKKSYSVTLTEFYYSSCLHLFDLFIQVVLLRLNVLFTTETCFTQSD